MVDIRKAITTVQQNKRINGTVISVTNGVAAVKILGSNQILRGLSITGNAPITGQRVYIDYTSGKPVVQCYSDLSTNTTNTTTKTVQTTRTIIADPEVSQNDSYNVMNSGSGDDENIPIFDLNGQHIKDSGINIDQIVTEAPDDGYDYARKNLAWSKLTIGGGTGDVVGPASSTAGHIAVFDDATGKVIRDGGEPGGAGSVPASVMVYMSKNFR